MDHRLRRIALGLLVVTVGVVLVGGVATILRAREGQAVFTRGADSTTTTVAPTTSTPDDASVTAEAIWPPASHAQYEEPVAAARSFVEEYVGIAGPPLSEFRAGTGTTGEVDLYLRGEGGEVFTPRRTISTVSLRRADGHWRVMSARTEEIVVDNPRPLDTVGSPVVVNGRGRGFEGNILVSVRDGGMGAGRSLAEKPTTAGCCQDLEPFHVELTLTGQPSQPVGSILLVNDTASFAALPVRFGPPAGAGQASDETRVEVYWVNPAGQVVGSSRTVRSSAGVLRSALQQLLSGPTSQERDAGLSSALAGEAAAVPFSVAIDSGVAVVDFGAALPAASPGTSSSAASGLFLRQLHATVFQFPTVTRAEYRAGGQCDRFWAWLQRRCATVDRANIGL